MATQVPQGQPHTLYHIPDIEDLKGVTSTHIESSTLLPSAPTPTTTPATTTATSTRTTTTTPQSGQWRDIETQALVVHAPNAPFTLETVYLDEVRDDEILIEMRYSGICHTDLVMQAQILPLTYPAILGHEGSGIILSIGSSVANKSLKVGDRVLLSFNSCASCKPCLTNHPAFCQLSQPLNFDSVRPDDRSTSVTLRDDGDGDGDRSDGGSGKGKSVSSQFFGQSSFSRRSVVKERCVVKVPDFERCSSDGDGDGGDVDVDDFMGIYAPLGCGVQTGAGTVLNVLKPAGPEDSIVVFGMGTVGLSALMAAKYLDVRTIIAVDIVDAKLDMAKELGATHVINSGPLTGEGELVREIKSVTVGGGGPMFAIDCTGILPVIEAMIECLGHCGTAATVGVPPPGKKIGIDAWEFMQANKRYIGVIEGDSVPSEFIPRLIKMHREGKFPVDKLCKMYPVEKMQEALDDMHAGRVIKPVLCWN